MSRWLATIVANIELWLARRLASVIRFFRKLRR
jgi:hypothetical protein